MFIRAKVISGKKYYYLVESYRSNGKVCQRDLAYLGKMNTVEAAVRELKADVAGWEGSRLKAMELLQEQKTDHMKEKFIKFAKRSEMRRDRAQRQLDKIKAALPGECVGKAVV